MHDLRPHLTSLIAAGVFQPRGAGAPIIQFMAARRGEGTSSVAASAALLACESSARPVWLIDADFTGNAVYNAFAEGRLSGIGRPGRPLDASLGTPQIYRLAGGAETPGSGKLLTLHQIGETRLFVTRFRTERLAPGQSVHFTDAPDWWQAVRRIAGCVVIDCPAFSDASLALRLAAVADGAVLVVGADATPAAEVAALASAYQAAGGQVLGTVLNRSAMRR
ncbi:hypothetical protein [Hyphomonas sp.]|uniref:hypothetical protein n=1 Tax=Hyphomonas sp. TaxID=87 RepID=UPI00391DD2C6